MNRVWLKREKKKVQRVKGSYDAVISTLKRQLAHAKPYLGVLKEREITRLRHDLREERCRALSGHARRRNPEDDDEDELDGELVLAQY